MARFASNQEFFEFVRESIARLNTNGHSMAALQLSDGLRAMNGLTDGWGEFLDAVQNVQTEFGELLPPEEREALERIRMAAYRAVYRT